MTIKRFILQLLFVVFVIFPLQSHAEDASDNGVRFNEASPDESRVVDSETITTTTFMPSNNDATRHDMNLRIGFKAGSFFPDLLKGEFHFFSPSMGLTFEFGYNPRDFKRMSFLFSLNLDTFYFQRHLYQGSLTDASGNPTLTGSISADFFTTFLSAKFMLANAGADGIGIYFFAGLNIDILLSANAVPDGLDYVDLENYDHPLPPYDIYDAFNTITLSALAGFGFEFDLGERFGVIAFESFVDLGFLPTLLDFDALKIPLPPHNPAYFLFNAFSTATSFRQDLVTMVTYKFNMSDFFSGGKNQNNLTSDSTSAIHPNNDLFSNDATADSLEDSGESEQGATSVLWSESVSIKSSPMP